MGLIGKIIIISIGVIGLLLLLLLMAAACELMAKCYRETHVDEFANNQNYCNNDDYESPFYKITTKEMEEQ